MSGVGVRSGALSAASRAVDDAAGELRCTGAHLLGVTARCRPPPGGTGAARLLVGWLRLEGAVAAAVGPGGVLGEALALEALSVRLGLAARAYERVEAAVAAVMASVARATDAAAPLGWLTEEGAEARVRVVEPGGGFASLHGVADLVAAGAGLEAGRVRVLEVASGGAGSAWVVVVPGTQRWSPVPGPNPFDLTTGVRAVTVADQGTVAAAGVALALERARAASGRSAPDDPVLLVGHSQGGVLAAALASDAAFARRHRVTHLLTTGAPVGLYPVPPSVRVLSVEHADDPVPGLDLTPSPARDSWVTVPGGGGGPGDGRGHSLGGYVETVRALTEGCGGPVACGAAGGVAGWAAGAAAFVGRPVRSVTEVEVTRLASAADVARGP